MSLSPQLHPTGNRWLAPYVRAPRAMLASLLGVALALAPIACAAQQQAGAPGGAAAPAPSADAAAILAAGPALATRAELQSLASSLDQDAAAGANRERAALIRARLADGDFRTGDRLYVTVSGPMVVVDTVSVRAGDSITVKGITDVSLHGVLRSELEPTISAAVAKLVRGAVVRAGPLLWLAVLGGVQKPGFYAMSPDVLLGDALMRAGGPSTQSDLGRTVVNRDGKKLYDEKYITTVLTQGISLDQLALHSGDQIVVGEKKPKSVSQILQATAALLSIGFGLYGLSRRR